MALIKSISGIRGTIGGNSGDNLTPVDIIRFSSAFGQWIRQNNPGDNRKSIVLGRDARISGEMVRTLVAGTLTGLGIDVIDCGLCTTPGVEIAVTDLEADGGIIITASHNPGQWNALKLLNNKGEFISAGDGQELLELADKGDFHYADIYKLGQVRFADNINKIHINKISGLELVDIPAIKKAGFKVVIDCVNSVGGVVIPELLRTLGVDKIVELNCDPTGMFSHNPEPLPANLTEISDKIKEVKGSVGFVVDPDVDRLAIVNEDGSMFGEEYTLVAVADYILQHTPGNTVSNMSSTMALREITEKYGGNHSSSAVGEVNVVSRMKETNAVIGGEGNGGVIYPPLHYGRDALAGIALFLSLLARSGKKCSGLRAGYPDYVISKNKITLTPEINVDNILEMIKERYNRYDINTEDGVKIILDDEWIHLRKSNTEPIIRIYSESRTKEKADKLAKKIMDEIISSVSNK